MDNLTKQKVQEQLTKAQSVLVSVSKKSGFDGLASGLALYLSIKKLGKNVTIVAKAPTVSDARMLYGVDKIGQVSEKGNLVVVVDNAVENVDKITYYLDGNKLKIVVHAFPQSQGVSQADIAFETAQPKPDFVIGVGYLEPDEMRNDITHEQQLDPSTFIINITLQDLEKKIAHVNFCNPTAPALAEVTSEFFQILALPMDEDVAFNIYSGLAGATQMFSPSIAKESTLSIAAWLLKFGAGRAGLAQAVQIQTPASEQINPIQPPKENDFKSPLAGTQSSQYEINQTPLENVEKESMPQKEWLKPPKIYHGSKSFDIES